VKYPPPRGNPLEIFTGRRVVGPRNTPPWWKVVGKFSPNLGCGTARYPPPCENPLEIFHETRVVGHEIPPSRWEMVGKVSQNQKGWGSEIPPCESTGNFPQGEGCGGTKSLPPWLKPVGQFSQNQGRGAVKYYPPPRENPVENFHKTRCVGHRNTSLLSYFHVNIFVMGALKSL